MASAGLPVHQCDEADQQGGCIPFEQTTVVVDVVVVAGTITVSLGVGELLKLRQPASIRGRSRVAIAIRMGNLRRSPCSAYWPSILLDRLRNI
jgi:hypothetical protein